MSDMRMAISVLNKLRDNWSRQWKDARKINHKGIALTSGRWLYTNPYYAIKPYLNGREVGFAIEVVGGKIGGQIVSYEDRKVVIFSENRNSDDLVVYIGIGTDFDTDQMNPHFIFKSERRYRENSTYFSPYKLDEAVEFIERELFNIQIEENEDVWKEDEDHGYQVLEKRFVSKKSRVGLSKHEVHTKYLNLKYKK